MVTPRRTDTLMGRRSDARTTRVEPRRAPTGGEGLARPRTAPGLRDLRQGKFEAPGSLRRIAATNSDRRPVARRPAEGGFGAPLVVDGARSTAAIGTHHSVRHVMQFQDPERHVGNFCITTEASLTGYRRGIDVGARVGQTTGRGMPWARDT